MKQRPKAPWYRDPGISADEKWVNQVDKALGLCHGCIHTRVGIDPENPCQITVTCDHSERQGPGKGLSTDLPCSFRQTVDLSEATPEAKEVWGNPLQVCPDCMGTGLNKNAKGLRFGPTKHPCDRCFGTGSVAHEPCPKCNDTGVIETGNNDLPCECPAGDLATFNCAGRGPVKGAVLKAERAVPQKPCLLCSGKGVVYNLGVVPKPCHWCEGKGSIPK